jgi:cytochrome c peroxidase
MRVPRLIAIAAVFAVVALSVHATTTTIEQSGQLFSEKSMKLRAGDSILFANHDDVTHNINVVDEDDNATDLGLQKPGETLTYKFDKNGRFKVRCSIHPSMKMTVDVN